MLAYRDEHKWGQNVSEIVDLYVTAHRVTKNKSQKYDPVN